MCSITCESTNVFANSQTLLAHQGNLNKHAVKHHEGKTIFLNMLENQLIFIDSPMTVEYDHLFFDLIKQPMKIDMMDFSTSSNWVEYTLDKYKLKLY